MRNDINSRPTPADRPSSGESIAIQFLEERHDDATRTLQSLPEFADGRRSVLRDRLTNDGLHFLETRLQKNNLGSDFYDASLLDEKIQRFPCF